MVSFMFDLLFSLYTALALLFFEPGLRVELHKTPKQAPDFNSVPVLGFSVRKTGSGKPFEWLKSPALVSDPSTWQAFTGDAGAVIYGYDHNIVVVEHEGTILATFQAKASGISQTKVTIRTAVPTELSCWGGGKTVSSKEPTVVHVANRAFATPGGFLKEIGLSFFVVSRDLFEATESGDPLIQGARLPVSWQQVDPRTYELFIGGVDADIYLSHAKAKRPRDYVKFLYGLTGKAKLPPIYALGFMASRWGWEDRAYISSVLDEFDVHGIPIDAFIMDFEWYLNMTGGDYLIPSSGLRDYPDFRFGNSKTFPNLHSQAEEYRGRKVKMGGIRKPRLGDAVLLEEVRSKKWTLARKLKSSRDLNFALPELRQWYGQKTRALLAQEGIPDFFWNDEGETSYFTYHHWIEAQQLAVSAQTNPKRRFSLNRAFTPGLQRLEAVAVWTGDIDTTWASLSQTVDMLVRWSEAGVSLPSFDIGGFMGRQSSGYEEVLARWYQVGVFAGVMRVHSILQHKPHFPFSSLWGHEAASAMKAAVQLRYSLIPTILSSLYHLQSHAVPFIERKDLSDMTKPVRDFLFAGRRLFVAPVLRTMNATETNDFIHRVEFPRESKWYPLARGAPIENERTLNIMNVPLGMIPLFAREGSIILLHGDESMSTRAVEMVGGKHTLTLLIFAHSSNSSAVFTSTLFEDDGESLSSSVRATTFEFNQAEFTLGWRTEGSNDAPRWYRDVLAILRVSDGQTIEHHCDLSESGTISLRPENYPVITLFDSQIPNNDLVAEW